MPIATSLKDYLSSEGLEYQVLSHAPAESARAAAISVGIDAFNVVHGFVLRDWRGALLVVLPSDHEPDIEAINRQLQRDFELTHDLSLPANFQDCPRETLPPLLAVYGLKLLMDSRLNELEHVYFRGGSSTELIRVSARGFQLLQRGAWHGAAIAHQVPMPAPTLHANITPLVARMDLRARVRGLSQLPAMPEMAQRILQLRANPYANVLDLARIVELDPSLSAQIMRYASSPLFGYRGNLDSIQDAISRVLGYDMVMNIALGISAGSALNIPKEGPFGLRAFWRDAVYTATLTQALSKILPRELRPRPGLAYLAGLLHDFGFLLMGHLFRDEFIQFNRLAEEQPDLPISELEKQSLDVTHSEMGCWLMEAWQLPSEIIVAVREHHNPNYTDLYSIYSRLVLVANHLLKHHGIGDADSAELPVYQLRALGLTEEQVQIVLQSVLDSEETLEAMARQLAA